MARRAPPGSLGAPLLGETWSFVRDPYDFTLSRTREHGNVWRTRLLGETVVFFAGPHAISFVTAPGNFVREGVQPRNFEKLLHPDHPGMTDGEPHDALKRKLVAALTEQRIDSYLPGSFQVIERFARNWAGAGERTFADDLAQLAFDVADHLFGAADPLRSDPALASDAATVQDGLLGIPVNLPVTAYGKARRARERLCRHVRSRLDEADPLEMDGTVMGALLADAAERGEEFDREYLVTQLVALYLAAHAGLTTTFAWLLTVFGQQPALAGSIREEADEVLDDGPPSVAQIRELTTARAVTREVLRAFPLVPFTMFGEATRDLEFDGFEIPAGCKGAGALWATLQDASVFADPDRFRGGRLDDEAVTALPTDAYVPMGGGPLIEGHRCAGESLVVLLLTAFTGWFNRHYDWVFPDQDSSPAPGVFPLPRGGPRGAVRHRVPAGGT